MPKLGRQKIAPSILGRIYPPYAHAPRTARGRTNRPPKSYTRPFQLILPSAPNLTQARRQRYDAEGNLVQTPSQAIFSHADALYTSFDSPTRKAWRQAVKAPQMSGYDLWMKEATSLMHQGYRPNQTPSHSGGFSNRRLSPGHTLPYPKCSEAISLRRLWLLFIHKSDNPATHSLYRIHWTYSQPPPYPETSPDFLIFQVPRPFFQPPGFYYFWSNASFPPDPLPPFHSWPGCHQQYRPTDPIQVVGVYFHKDNNGFWYETKFSAIPTFPFSWATFPFSPISPTPTELWNKLAKIGRSKLPP